MGAGGSHPQATFDPEQTEEEEEETKEGQQRKKEGQQDRARQWILRSAKEWWSESSPFMKWGKTASKRSRSTKVKKRSRTFRTGCEEGEAEKERRGVGEVERRGEEHYSPGWKIRTISALFGI